MRLICPVCGAMCSAEAWQNDATCRTFIDLLLRFSGEVRNLVLPYLGLFRTGKSGLTWSRAYRLVADLHTLVDTGNVQWDGGELRPASPSLWAQALDSVLERRPKALQNHNYLRRVGWEMAGPIAARREREGEAKRRGDGETRRRGEEKSPPTPLYKGGDEDGGDFQDDQPATEEQIAEMKRMLKEFSSKFGG